MTERGLGILAGCMFALLGAAAFVIALSIPARMPVGIDSGVLPEIFAAGLVACGLLLASTSALAPGRAAGTRPADEKAEGSGTVPLVVNVVLIVGYVACLGYLGFILSSAIFLFLQISLLDDRSLPHLARHAAFAVLATILIWALFAKGFGLLLPSGMLG